MLSFYFSYVRENELPVESEDAPLLPEPDEALELHADDEGFRCEPGEREGKKRRFYQAVRFPYLKVEDHVYLKKYS